MDKKEYKSRGGHPKACWTIDNGTVLISKSISAMADKLVMNGSTQEPHNILDANKSSLRQKRKQDGFVGDGGSFKYKKWEIFMGDPPEGYYDGMKIKKEEKDPISIIPADVMLLGRGYINDKWHSDLMFWER